MKSLVRLAATAGAAIGLSAVALPAVAGADPSPEFPPFAVGADHAVFVQTDNPAGNQIVAYHRNDDGTLVPAGTYATGGLAAAPEGSAVDHLASQGSLAYDPLRTALCRECRKQHRLRVLGTGRPAGPPPGGVVGRELPRQHRRARLLRRRPERAQCEPPRVCLVFRTVGSAAGIEPVPRIHGAQWKRGVRQHTQVVFAPDGSQLLVTTKQSGSAVDVFRVGPLGYLSVSPVVNAEPGAVPFGVSFDAAQHLVVADAGTNALSTFTLAPNGTLAPIDTVATGQSATCWVASAQGSFFASNAGSADVSGYQEQPSGELTLLGATGTDPGTVDAAPSAAGSTSTSRRAGTASWTSSRSGRRVFGPHRFGGRARLGGRRRHRRLLAGSASRGRPSLACTLRDGVGRRPGGHRSAASQRRCSRPSRCRRTARDAAAGSPTWPSRRGRPAGHGPVGGRTSSSTRRFRKSTALNAGSWVISAATSRLPVYAAAVCTEWSRKDESAVARARRTPAPIIDPWL